MERPMGKTDRMLRLLKVFILLSQNPQGIEVAEIARRFGVTKRTIYRDLVALEDRNYLGIPIWEEGSKRGIDKDYLLPPIPFSLPEAMGIFLAARLMLKYADRYDPNIASTFLKLNSVVPPPLRDHVQKTVDWLQTRRTDQQYQRVMRDLIEAWSQQHTMKIWHRSLGEEKARERKIDPYFIEPAAAGHSSYVIAHCHRANALRIFKIERISAVENTGESYEIPADFDANSYLASSWGVIVEGEVKTIRLRFNAEIAPIMYETVWHPSQKLEPQEDDSVIVTMRLTDTVELRAWILGWGEKVEVLEPEELRQEMIETARAILDTYRYK